MLFLHVNEITEAIITFLLLVPFFLSGKIKSGIKLAIMYYGFLMIDYFCIPLLNDRIAILVSMVVVSLRMILPCIIAGTYAFMTTTVSEFICALRKIHVSECVIIPCMVIIRFFPTIKEDYSQIRNAMAFRGVGVGKFSLITQPMKTLEYIIIPLLMNGNNVSQDLSIAALTKGIGVKGNHTCVEQIKVKAIDYIYILICILPLILFKKGVI